MKGKWFTLLAALFIVTAMLFALTGCGGTGETGGGGEQAAEPEASENETENTESLPADTERAVTGGAVSGMTNADSFTRAFLTPRLRWENCAGVPRSRWRVGTACGHVRNIPPPLFSRNRLRF